MVPSSQHLTQTVRVMEGFLEDVTYEQSSKEVGGITQEENNRESKVPSKEYGHTGEQIKQASWEGEGRLREERGGRDGLEGKKGCHDKGASKPGSTSQISSSACGWMSQY